MSVIQKIRDKYARWAVIAIALSLLGFIMMDAFAGRTGLFSGDSQSTTLGKVNGQTIDYREFALKVETQKREMGVSDEMQTQRLTENLWEQEVMNIIMEAEYEKLGLTVTDKELKTSLLMNPPEQWREQFKDSAGNLNTALIQQQVNELLKRPNGKEDIEGYLLMKKYMALLSNTVHIPNWFLEKKNADQSLVADFAYVSIPYATVSDSLAKVTDEEIEAYVKANKKRYEQKEETRSFDFVTISAAPTSADSAAISGQLLALKDTFARLNDNYDRFVRSNGSAYPFYDGYVMADKIPLSNKDSLLKLPVGSVFGPFVEVNPQNRRGMFVLSKLIGVKQWPDSVKVRHILVASQQIGDGTPMSAATRDSLTKAKADSILGLIRQGENFDSLVVKFSDDPGSKNTGGVYEFAPDGGFVAPFTEFSCENKPGQIGIVKTDYGYHIIEVMSHKGSVPVYKTASISKEIIPSDETEQEASILASQFASESSDVTSFNENYNKMLRDKSVFKSTATVKPLDANVPGLEGQVRGFVKRIYEAKRGQVLDPERVGNVYVVAVVTEIREPGLPNAQQARPMVEYILVNRKKAEILKKELGQVNSLEEVATKKGQQVQSVDSVHFENPRALGFEPRVIGAVFNPENKGKLVQPIAGTQGVYVIRVDNLRTVPVETSIDDLRATLESQQEQLLNPQFGGGPIQALKNAADVKDYRYKFY